MTWCFFYCKPLHNCWVHRPRKKVKKKKAPERKKKKKIAYNDIEMLKGKKKDKKSSNRV